MWALSNVVYKLHDKVMVEKLIECDIMSILLEMLQRDADSGSIASLALTTTNELLNKCDNARVAFLRMGG